MTIFAAQYLDSAPENATPVDARSRLSQAFDRLPLSLILTGWDLPPAFEDAVAEETLRHSARLFRWQPWLTGDAHTHVPPEWYTLGLEGSLIPGHEGAPDFTFMCPNRSSVSDFLSERLEEIAARGLYQGIFLDRIRFPSPAPDPAVYLGCFCPHCIRLAADDGLDLEAVRHTTRSLFTNADGVLRLARGLLGKTDGSPGPLEAFLDFRARSITRVVKFAKQQAQALGLDLGLDCYSPALTRMIGQDLIALDKYSDWIKIMTYPRVFGPAGISFELMGLSDWLTKRYGIREAEALACLREASGLPIPATYAELAKAGLGSDTMKVEIERGRAAGVTTLLAGIALVEMKAIHESTPEQIQADLHASRAADGLVISWNLWFTPLEYLDTIRKLWMC